MPSKHYYSERNQYNLTKLKPETKTVELYRIPVHISHKENTDDELTTMKIELLSENEHRKTVHGWFVVHENLRHLTGAPLKNPLKDLNSEIEEWNAWFAGEVYGIERVIVCTNCNHSKPLNNDEEINRTYGYIGREDTINVIEIELKGTFTGEMITPA